MNEGDRGDEFPIRISHKKRKDGTTECVVTPVDPKCRVVTDIKLHSVSLVKEGGEPIKKALGEKLNIHSKSTNNEHTTPREFYNRLNAEFKFTLDPAATIENALCKRFFTQEDDGLSQSWVGERVFCNPPYGRGLGAWVQKACEETNEPDTCELVVLLIPARPDTKYWHNYILHAWEGAYFGYVDHRWVEVRFLKGRLKFGDQKNSAPFPSALIIYKGGHGLLTSKSG